MRKLDSYFEKHGHVRNIRDFKNCKAIPVMRDKDSVIPIIMEDCGRFISEESDFKSVPACIYGEYTCDYLESLETVYIAFCKHKLSRNKLSEDGAQLITYRAFELAEPAIKQAIAQAIEEQFG